MDSDPKPIFFDVVYFSGKIQKSVPIYHFDIIEHHVIKRGLYGIRSIIFYFTIKPGFFYPYGFHNIVFHYKNSRLETQFYHYYDWQNQRRELSPDQQLCDYEAIYLFLQSYPYLLSYVKAPLLHIT